MGGGEFVGNLKVFSEILEALPPPPLGKVNFSHWPLSMTDAACEHNLVTNLCIVAASREF